MQSLIATIRKRSMAPELHGHVTKISCKKGYGQIMSKKKKATQAMDSIRFDLCQSLVIPASSALSYWLSDVVCRVILPVVGGCITSASDCTHSWNLLAVHKAVCFATTSLGMCLMARSYALRSGRDSLGPLVERSSDSYHHHHHHHQSPPSIFVLRDNIACDATL
jgi:hypothetical protein